MMFHRIFLLVLQAFLLKICGGNDLGTCNKSSQCESQNSVNKTLLFQTLYSEKCNIPRVVGITEEQFLVNYAFTSPVIIVNATDNSDFRSLCDKEKLLEDHGDKVITLSTANTYSYDKVDITFREYMQRILKPQDYEKSGRNTLYFFGNHDYSEWKDLFDEYKIPPYELPGKSAALSFGIAAAGTGVPFHFHGPGFAEVITGQKRWFLLPYENKPLFDPNETTLRWINEKYHKVANEKQFFECVLKPGELLYFPDKWWHATLNIEDAVFMSTFLS